MPSPIRILLQTTIPHIEDDWNIDRFSMLRDYLSELTDVDGSPLCAVTARNRATPGGPDPILSTIDRSDYDELWLFVVDAGDGLHPEDCTAIGRFRQAGRGLLVTRGHMDLSSSVCTLGGVGAAHCFYNEHLDPDKARRVIGDCDTREILWPNYHSGANGDFQEIAIVGDPHPVLRDPEADGGLIRYLPAHPHEGEVGAPLEDSSSRVVATGTNKASNRQFNIAVAFEPVLNCGPAWAESTFHHFADYNWDPTRGCPSFVSEESGDALSYSSEAQLSILHYSRNLALWLAGRQAAWADRERRERALDEALEESFPASDPPALF